MNALDPRVTTILVEAQRVGIIGKAPLESHIDQARAFFSVVADLVEPSAQVLDLGSGGGLPGLVVAATWPELHVALLDGRSNRAENLSAAVETLGFGDRVQVIAQRAEEAGRETRHRHVFDLVVARGFGPPAVTAECAVPFLKVGGLLVVSDPPGGGMGDRWPEAGSELFGLRVERIQVDPWAFTVLRQVELCSDTYPRRTGLPQKRPLFA
ncbi:MAG TPA: RsmG family class I SAM-dependent methyltransferase [Acidimicrobiales bacterium]|nr:RsmG family class I SAM-dependent methyltransferase [Acidimicrobiales bacterium]